MSSINLRKLWVFRIAAEQCSLTLTARDLGISQPAVRAHIRGLEEFFGAPLFQQEGKQMKLTEAGRAAYTYALDVLSSTEKARQLVSLVTTARGGTVRVGASESPAGSHLPRQLLAFKAMCPEAAISMEVASAFGIWDRIRHGSLDCAVVAGPPPPDDLTVVRYSYEPLTVACAVTDERAYQVVEPADLWTSPVIAASRWQADDERYRAFGLDSEKILIRLGSDEAIKHAVETGMGIAVMFRCALERELTRHTLAEVFVKGVDERRPFYLITNAKKNASPIQRRLTEFLISAPRD